MEYEKENKYTIKYSKNAITHNRKKISDTCVILDNNINSNRNFLNKRSSDKSISSNDNKIFNKINNLKDVHLNNSFEDKQIDNKIILNNNNNNNNLNKENNLNSVYDHLSDNIIDNTIYKLCCDPTDKFKKFWYLLVAPITVLLFSIIFYIKVIILSANNKYAIENDNTNYNYLLTFSVLFILFAFIIERIIVGIFYYKRYNNNNISITSSLLTYMEIIFIMLSIVYCTVREFKYF